MPSKENASRSSEILIRKTPKARARRLELQYGKSLQINRRVYKIIYCEEIFYNGSFNMGLCDAESCTLFVLANSEVEQTLVHEIMHAEFEESGLRQHPKYDDGVEEIVCEIAAKSLTSLYRLRAK